MTGLKKKNNQSKKQKSYILSGGMHLYFNGCRVYLLKAGISPRSRGNRSSASKGSDSMHVLGGSVLSDAAKLGPCSGGFVWWETPLFPPWLGLNFVATALRLALARTKVGGPPMKNASNRKVSRIEL